MPIEAVLHRLSSRKMTESLMMQIILHCAPVLKNVKMSSMFTVPAASSSPSILQKKRTLILLEFSSFSHLLFFFDLLTLFSKIHSKYDHIDSLH